MLTSFSSYVAVLGEAAIEDHRQEQVALARLGRDRHEAAVAEERRGRPSPAWRQAPQRRRAGRAAAVVRLGHRPTVAEPARYDGARCFPTADGSAPTSPSATGMVKAAERAAEIGRDALQVFTDNPTAWQRRAEPRPEIAGVPARSSPSRHRAARRSTPRT